MEAVRPLELQREQELVSHQLDETSVDQNPRQQRVEHPVDKKRRSQARSVTLTHPKTNSNGDGGNQGKGGGEHPGGPAVLTPVGGGDSQPQTESFEHLVENKHDVKGDELVTSDRQRQPGEHRVEQDTELKEEDTHKRARVLLLGDVFGGSAEDFVVLVVVGVAVVLSESVLRCRQLRDGDGVFVVIQELAQVVLVDLVDSALLHVSTTNVQVFGAEMGVGVATFLVVFVGKTIGNNFNKEHQENHHHAGGDRPRVLGDGTGKTLVAQVGRGGEQKMDERGGDDDPGPKELGEEETPPRHADNRVSTQQDGEKHPDTTPDHDDEDRRDTDTHAPIVLVTTVTHRGQMAVGLVLVF